MTDIEKVEALLNEYKILKIEIEAISIGIKSIGQKGINYTGMPSSKNVKDGIHNNYNELEKLKNDKFDKEIKIEQIENMLKVLSDEEYTIIKLIYFDELEIYKVAHQVNMHPNTLYNKRKRIFNNKLIQYAKRIKLI